MGPATRYTLRRVPRIGYNEDLILIVLIPFNHVVLIQHPESRSDLSGCYIENYGVDIINSCVYFHNSS